MEILILFFFVLVIFSLISYLQYVKIKNFMKQHKMDKEAVYGYIDSKYTKDIINMSSNLRGYIDEVAGKKPIPKKKKETKSK